MKSLFDANERYTEVALELDAKITSAIKDIISDYADRGYSIRDIEYVTSQSVGMECLSRIL